MFNTANYPHESGFRNNTNVNLHRTLPPPTSLVKPGYPIISNAKVDIQAQHLSTENLQKVVCKNDATVVRPLHLPDGSALYRTEVCVVAGRDDLESTGTDGSSEATLSQCELLKFLLYYLFPRDGLGGDYSALLSLLEHVWASHETEFRLIMGHLFLHHREVLLTLINKQRKASQVQSMVENPPHAQAPGMADQLLAVNELRFLRLQWKTLGARVGH